MMGNTLPFLVHLLSILALGAVLLWLLLRAAPRARPPIIVIPTAVLIFAAVAACLLRHISDPVSKRVVLERHYGGQAVRAQKLKIVETGPPLVVSNGDVLPGSSERLYEFLMVGSMFVFCIPASLAILWGLDKVLARGRAKQLVFDTFYGTWIEGDHQGTQSSMFPSKEGEADANSPEIADRLRAALERESNDPALLVMEGREAKFAAILEARDFLESSACLMAVLFHFPSELKSFLAFCGARASEFCPLDRARSESVHDCRAFVGHADLAATSADTDDAIQCRGKDIVCVLGDCHPVWKKDEEVLTSLSKRQDVRAVFQFVSSDEPPLRAVQSILNTAFLWSGVKASPYLEAPRIGSPLLKKTRRRYARHAVSDVSANTAEEWIRLNCPRLSGRHEHHR